MNGENTAGISTSSSFYDVNLPKSVPSTREDVVTDNPPKVLISGAGIAGLFLALLLEKAEIPYEIFERTKEVSPLGSIMCLTANILPAVEQIGLYEEVLKISHPIRENNFYDNNMNEIAKLSSKDHKDITGYDVLLFPRSDFHELLLSKVPKEKVHRGKRVLSFLQNEQGVMIRLQDGTSVHGDILVGADGASSAVRQHLYKELKKHDKLPHGDLRSPQKGFLCLVGTTDPLDPAKYPGIETAESITNMVVGDKSCLYSWVLFTVPGNRICWSIITQHDADGTLASQVLNSDWSPILNESIVKPFLDFKTPYGKLGDLIEKTPQSRISRSVLGDLIFETWQYSRTALIGDAAHMMLPGTGQGAVVAMEDATVLANCLFELKPLSYKGIRAALKDYYDQRYPHVKAHNEANRLATKIQFGQTMLERALRHLLFQYLPKSVQKKRTSIDTQYRPYISFLPPPPIRGPGRILSQRPSIRLSKERQSKTDISLLKLPELDIEDKQTIETET